MKLFVIAVSLLLLARAPMQCTRSPDPDLRQEDAPGDALFALAMKFRNEGNRAASDATLKYLIEKYPSDRHADTAREMLAGNEPPAAAAQTAPARSDGGA